MSRYRMIDMRVHDSLLMGEEVERDVVLLHLVTMVDGDETHLTVDDMPWTITRGEVVLKGGGKQSWYIADSMLGRLVRSPNPQRLLEMMD